MSNIRLFESKQIRSVGILRVVFLQFTFEIS